MNTATNNGFHERQSIEEFLGEHEVVKELYAVARRSFGRRNLFSSAFLLHQFGKVAENSFFCHRNQ